MSKIVAIYALLLRKTFGPKFSGRVNLLVEKSHVWAFLSISFSINFVFLKICSMSDGPRTEEFTIEKQGFQPVWLLDFGWAGPIFSRWVAGITLLWR